MRETIRDDGFEATFVVSTPRKEAWDRLREAKPAFDGMGSAREGQWWIPGVEAPADELDVDPPSMLRARKAVEPCKGTEIVITLEDEGTGTRITVVQTGFGPGFSASRAWLTAGWHQILADYVVFFERGVSLGRHATPWWSLGCDVTETPEGLVASDVRADGLAGQAGLQDGDLILHIAGSPVINVRDLSMIFRGPLRAGTEAKVRYLRGTEVRSGKGTV